MARWLPRWIAPLVSFALALTAGAATRNNDDSCDIGVVPAATLLLPYFEVDLDRNTGETTIFTITNVSNLDRIARVTIWTDYGYPVLTFNVQLTGYAVQGISLDDIIARGIVGPQTPPARGRYSDSNPANECGALPHKLPREHVLYIQRAFTEGVVSDLGAKTACNNVGNEHENAIGYATVDLVRNCSTNEPFAPEYWTEDLAFDNVLIGDTQQIHSDNDSAQGSPMVHIRAIPEGGTPGERIAHHQAHGSNFPRTFYARYQPLAAPNLDSRQPLPSVFAARWISGGPSGFNTFFKIWREGISGATATCPMHHHNVTYFQEIVVFDEAENAFGNIPSARGTPITMDGMLAATSMTAVTDIGVFPRLPNGAIAGWAYFNLDHSQMSGVRGSNWVVASMRAEGRYSVDLDAAALGNGCSAWAPHTEITIGTEPLGPRPNATP